MACNGGSGRSEGRPNTNRSGYNVDLMPGSVNDAGPALNQHCIHVFCWWGLQGLSFCVNMEGVGWSSSEVLTLQDTVITLRLQLFHIKLHLQGPHITKRLDINVASNNQMTLQRCLTHESNLDTVALRTCTLLWRYCWVFQPYFKV